MKKEKGSVRLIHVSWLYWARRLLDQGACLGAVVNHKSVMWVILVILCAALGKYWGTKLLNASTVNLTSTEPLQRLSLFTSLPFFTLVTLKGVFRIVSMRFLFCLKARQVELPTQATTVNHMIHKVNFISVKTVWLLYSSMKGKDLLT